MNEEEDSPFERRRSRSTTYAMALLCCLNDATFVFDSSRMLLLCFALLFLYFALHCFALSSILVSVFSSCPALECLVDH